MSQKEQEEFDRRLKKSEEKLFKKNFSENIDIDKFMYKYCRKIFFRTMTTFLLVNNMLACFERLGSGNLKAREKRKLKDYSVFLQKLYFFFDKLTELFLEIITKLKRIRGVE